MHQVLGVRQHRMGGVAHEIDVPYPDQRRHGRQVAFQWRVAEVLVHFVGAAQQFLEAFEADGQCNRQTDG